MFCEGHVEGLLKAERRAVGVDQVELLLAEAGTYLVQAVLAVARLASLPLFSCLVEKGLRGAVQLAGPAPIAQVAGETCQAEAGVGQTGPAPVPAAYPQACHEHRPRTLRVTLPAQDLAQVDRHVVAAVSDRLR